MSGDEGMNFQQIQQWTNGETGTFELNASPEMLSAISPIYHLERLQVPISIHHSLDDQTVPYIWSEQLCQALQAIQHPVECFAYSGVPHTFAGRRCSFPGTDDRFFSAVLNFYTPSMWGWPCACSIEGKHKGGLYR